MAGTLPPHDLYQTLNLRCRRSLNKPGIHFRAVWSMQPGPP